MERRGVAALIAEFVGTFVLVFTIILVVSMYALQADVARGFTYPFIALAHGLVLLVLIHTLGGVSGAHFNPAVTVALGLLKKISWSDAVIYILVQLLGAAVAALLVKGIIADQAGTVNYAANLVNDKEINLGAAMVLEAFGTMILVWAILGTAVRPGGPADWAPIVIGGALALGVLLIAPLTGAGFNPARSFGPALIGNKFGDAVDFLLAYVAAPLLGAMLAVGLYVLMFGNQSGPAREPDAAVESPA